MRSVLLDAPGAVARASTGPDADPTDADPTDADQPTDPDAAIAWHYGDPLAEQRAAVAGAALFDLSHREVLSVSGDDRLTWLHTLTSQALDTLDDGAVTGALVLSPQGHVEHEFGVTVVGDRVFLDTEPGSGAALAAYLESMKFWSNVEVQTVPLALLRLTGPKASDDFFRAPGGGATDFAAAPSDTAPYSGALPYGAGFLRTVEADQRSFPQVNGHRQVMIDVAVDADQVGVVAAHAVAAGATLAGSWAADALRIPTRTPRLHVDTDQRTIPNETSWLQSAVHLTKGCYRGQETVARVDNLGRPPRRLVMLHLDGSVDRLPNTGDPVTLAETGRTVGRVGTVAHHWEDGPIALALVKRAALSPGEHPHTPGGPLLAGGVDAAVDPDDLLTDDEQTPRSVIDRAALPTLRRPR